MNASETLSGDQLAALAALMLESSDPAEIARIRAEIIRRFYGEQAGAQ